LKVQEAVGQGVVSVAFCIQLPQLLLSGEYRYQSVTLLIPLPASSALLHVIVISLEVCSYGVMASRLDVGSSLSLLEVISISVEVTSDPSEGIPWIATSKLAFG